MDCIDKFVCKMVGDTNCFFPFQLQIPSYSFTIIENVSLHFFQQISTSVSDRHDQRSKVQLDR